MFHRSKPFVMYCDSTALTLPMTHISIAHRRSTSNVSGAEIDPLGRRKTFRCDNVLYFSFFVAFNCGVQRSSMSSGSTRGSWCKPIPCGVCTLFSKQEVSKVPSW